MSFSLVEILVSPIFWIPFGIFLFVLAYFRWCEQKEKEEKQREKEQKLNERIRTLEENQKQNEVKS